MPPRSGMVLGVFAELAEQARFSPRGVVLRYVSGAEGLAEDVEAGGVYPWEWVVFRVTGYRPEGEWRGVGAEVARGGELLADLSAFVEHLTATAGLGESEVGEAVLTVEGLSERWGVGRKTLERWRRLGLVAWRVRGENGRERTVFPVRGVESFERRRAELVGRARVGGGRERMSEGERRRVYVRAVRYRRVLGWSRHRSAVRLAERMGRSVSAVEAVLRGEDERACRETGRRVFVERLPPRDRERRAIARAVWGRGVEPGWVCVARGLKMTTVRRAVVQGRADLLRGLELGGGEGVLGEGVGGGLGGVLGRVSEGSLSGLWVEGAVELSGLVESMRGSSAGPAWWEAQAVADEREVRRAACGVVAGLGRPTALAGEVDEAEALLRWAARLRARVVSTQLKLIVETVESVVGARVERLPAEVASRLLMGSIRAASGAIERMEVGRGGRVASPVGLAVVRVVTRLARVWGVGVGREGVREGGAVSRWPSRVVVRAWPLGVVRWQRWLEADARVVEAVRGGWVGGVGGEVLRRRFGLGGGRPETVEEVCVAVGLPGVHVVRVEREAKREALAAWRARVGVRGAGV